MELTTVSNRVEELCYNNTDYASIYKELKKYGRPILDMIFYDKFGYIHEETEDRIKRRDDKFKKEVKTRYKSCIITGKSVRICEVAHIIPFSGSNYHEKYNPDNGLLLCRELHQLFDTKSNDLKINPETMCIELTEDILKDEGFQDYHQYNKKQLKIKLDDNTIKYLKQKYNN